MPTTTGKNILIHKFGRLDTATTDPKTVWGENTGLKTYSDTPFSVRMKSNQAGDTGQLIEITGIRDISGVWTYSTETATTDGANAVLFPQSDWVRVFRAKNLANEGSELAGTVNFYRNAVEADVEVRLLAGYEQSTFGGITVPDNYVGYIHTWGASSTSTKTIVRLYSRQEGKVFRLGGELDAVDYAAKRYHPPGLTFEARSDIEIRSILESGGASGAVSTDFDMTLAYQYQG